ncbi:tetraspanin-32 [Sorex fumeus]|uniref:tetraspanin-32 n=1 Tax=Sorex fumeus TaxID=62283 RepID=UPI0024AE63C7|nr:tetraspanin-32 [Sorex fumeus]
MGTRSRVRVAKCQLLVTSLFVMLLGLSLAALAALTYFGAPFAAAGRGSPERLSFQRWAFHTGLCLAALLGLGAVLSVVATLREAGGLMAGGFLSFALVFCALVQVAFWRARNPTQAEDTLLDAYDALYERAVHSAPGSGHQELAAIHDAFQCCGKSSPFSRLGSAEAHLCQGASGRQDCLRSIRDSLRTHGNVASALIGLGLAATAYAMLLCSFLWFAIRAGRGLDRKGQYALSPRACTRRPPQPSNFRHTLAGPAPHSWPEVDTARDSSSVTPQGYWKWLWPEIGWMDGPIEDLRMNISAQFMDEPHAGQAGLGSANTSFSLGLPVLCTLVQDGGKQPSLMGNRGSPE